MAGPPPLCPALPTDRQRGCCLSGCCLQGCYYLSGCCLHGCYLLPARLVLPANRTRCPPTPRAPPQQPPVPARPRRLPRAYAPGCSMATEQNTAGHAPYTARPRPLAAPPARRTLTRSTIGRRCGPAPPTKGRGAGSAPVAAGTRSCGAGCGGERTPDYSPQEALRRHASLIGWAARVRRGAGSPVEPRCGGTRADTRGRRRSPPAQATPAAPVAFLGAGASRRRVRVLTLPSACPLSASRHTRREFLIAPKKWRAESRPASAARSTRNVPMGASQRRP
ncbi:translation initiation factor IF-2-like [Corvus hawaiiensis]|uniref:translation initiation factor IF-2-like n=1 Tax=Corvus hawaiiensis TaxID=134902 RepID=UPI0020186C59|nr:translation initiation factor IF-2-like [Corvus hawaiiensis]